jgi:hypothetical protein
VQAWRVALIAGYKERLERVTGLEREIGAVERSSRARR